ncbi:hypothetical protein J7T55_001124 [Diaporthe amygdali]|uniref:uncharacterized protein n=1 Tax=Phomopsis amygdali TaxID=1214568 RepID=UPI0022FE0189|nr:uncharacterized protein J7T55_001124 [Diaporthe amygdali]KAJ0120267.1 hypothetical protein J7T55_001124 [Diaporthe amygdali]
MSSLLVTDTRQFLKDRGDAWAGHAALLPSPPSVKARPAGLRRRERGHHLMFSRAVFMDGYSDDENTDELNQALVGRAALSVRPADATGLPAAQRSLTLHLESV